MIEAEPGGDEEHQRHGAQQGGAEQAAWPPCGRERRHHGERDARVIGNALHQAELLAGLHPQHVLDEERARDGGERRQRHRAAQPGRREAGGGGREGVGGAHGHHISLAAIQKPNTMKNRIAP